MQCAEHPKIETYLRCGKCDKPICPKCMVQTPVGAKCKACAQLKRHPLFDVSASQYVMASGLGAFLAFIIGVAWSFLNLPFLSFLIPLGAGYLMGEVISQAVNRKRSIGLQVIVGLSVFAAYVFSRMVPFLAAGVLDGVVPNPAIVIELVRLIMMGLFRQPYVLLIVGLGVYLGVMRVR